MQPRYVDSWKTHNGYLWHERLIMNTMYLVLKIDGDYANLRRTDIDSDDIKLVARALLPAEISEGVKLKYELMQYEII